MSPKIEMGGNSWGTISKQRTMPDGTFCFLAYTLAHALQWTLYFPSSGRKHHRQPNYMEYVLTYGRMYEA